MRSVRPSPRPLRRLLRPVGADAEGERPRALTLTDPPGLLSLPADRPAVWLLEVNQQTPAALSTGLALLSDSERAEHRALPGSTALDHFAAARAGLRLLLSACTGIPPDRVAADQAACPRCAVPHGLTAGADEPVFFSVAEHGDLVLYACARTPVGAGLAPWQSGMGRAPIDAARSAARRQAYAACAPHGRCTPRRADEAHRSLSYVTVPGRHTAAVVRAEQ